MKDLPKVSVLIITYNHEKYIRQCLDSVLCQKVDFEYEIIIGNDNSPDNTQVILDEYKNIYPDNLTILNRRENLGATNNLFDLIKRSSGENVIFLEGDDYWKNNRKLQILVDVLDDNPDFIGVFHKVDEIDEAGMILSTYPRVAIEKYIDEINDTKQFLELTMKDNLGQVFHIQSLLFRNVFRNILDDSLKNYITCGKMICDVNIKMYVISRGRLMYLKENMGSYRRIRKEGGSSFSSQTKKFVYNETLKNWRNIDAFFKYKDNRCIEKIIKTIKMDYLRYKFKRSIFGEIIRMFKALV